MLNLIFTSFLITSNIHLIINVVYLSSCIYFVVNNTMSD